MSRPMASPIAAVATSHQNPNPRSWPAMALKTDLTTRAGPPIFSVSHLMTRGGKALMTECSKSPARASTRSTASDSLIRAASTLPGTVAISGGIPRL